MKYRVLFGCCLFFLMVCCAHGQEIRLTSGDTLAFAPNGTWRSVTIGERQLPITAGAPVVSVCDVERGGAYTPLLGTVRAAGGNLHMALASEPLDLKAILIISPAKFTLHIEDTTGRDRGLLVRVSVPVNAVGWQWWDDIERRRAIEPDRLYENVKPLRAFAALPEWKDKPDLRMGFNSPNFCTVISGPVGLCLAVPLDQPRIFRTGYDSKQKLFSITYDVALCRETAPPSQATFELELFGCHPQWGMRGALDAYYQRHSGFFTKNLKDEGMWIAFSRLNEIDNVTEFGVAIQEGAASFTYDDQIGVQSFSYYTHAGIYANVPEHNRNTDPTPSLERRIAAVEAVLKRTTDRDAVYAECGLHDAGGNLSAQPGSVYGDVLAQFCLEPELFYGRFLLDRIDSFFDSYRKRGGELDGFYYDGLTTGINYRREHFRHASYPPSWDPVAKKPYLYNYFSSVEWARQVADKLHTTGKLTMMNGAMGASPFCSPYLDVMGAETGLNIPRTDFNFVKTICRHKPFVTLLKGNYAKLTTGQIELFMKRCLAYGVFPGYFDWPPSGLGPGGRYWDHPEYYERDRLLFRKYQPLVKMIATAGWEPVTFARADDSRLQVERFGREFFTVLNDSTDPIRSSLAIATDKLNLPSRDLMVFDEVARRWIAANRKDGALVVPLELPPESVALIHVAAKEDFVAHHLDAARQLFEVADAQRKADAGRPPLPMYWAVTEERCFRDSGALLLRNESDKQTATASQWAMLFQTEPKPITIRARVKTQDINGKKSDSFALHAIVCYVDNRFTTRSPQMLPLEPGTSDWRDIEWTIQPTRPVRSVQLTLRLARRCGSAWFDNVSVRSADAEHVVDGGFDTWYERLTPEQATKLAPKLAASRPPTAKHLADALGAVQSASAAISEHHWNNPARRERRDLNDAWSHLTMCCQALLNISDLDLVVPDKVAPGETVMVTGNASLQSEPPLPITTQHSGHETTFQVHIPADAKPGTVFALRAEATVELAAGCKAPLRVERKITVVQPFEAEVTLEGESTLAVRLANNLSRPQRFNIAVATPAGWTLKETQLQPTIPPRTTQTMHFHLKPSATTKPGRHEITVTVQNKSFRVELNHLPATANRLKNPGFESTEGWSKWNGGYTLDSRTPHSGQKSLRLQTDAPRAHVGASQGVSLNQTKVVPLIARGWCKTENVSGDRSGCCLYVDIYYADGTKLYGQKVVFDGGTHDWQFREARIETTKPARSANVYLMLRGTTGAAWFDDVFLAEDSSPAGHSIPKSK